MSASARAAFEQQWRDKGDERRVAAKWLEGGTLLVVAEPDVDPAVAAKIVEGVRAQLAELGARRFGVETVPPPTVLEPFPCVQGGIISKACFEKRVRSYRNSDARFARSVVYYLTNAAIDRLPRDLGGGHSEGPPAGTASYSDGWMLQSFYYRAAHQKTDPTLARYGGMEFSIHSLEHTARHELGHLLGLPHHEALGNPGFPEALPCNKCTHRGSGAHRIAHAECLMTCGSGDDEWFHRETFGKGFGLCEKCRTAAVAYLRGLEGR